MKNILKLTCVAVVLCAASLCAGVSTSIETGVTDKYLTFGSGSVLSDEPGIQTNFNFEWDSGFYANVWLSRPLKRGVSKSDYIYENDVGIGYKTEIDYWSFDANVTLFDEPRLGRYGAGDIWFTSIDASRRMGPVNLVMGYNTYTPAKGSDFEGGHLVSLGFSKKHGSDDSRVTGSWFIKAAFDDGGFGYAKGMLLNYGGELNWKINKTVSLVLPRVEGFVPWTIKDSRKSDAMWFGGISLSL